VSLQDDAIVIMDRIRITDKGVVNGEGPAAERVQQIYNSFTGGEVMLDGIFVLTNQRFLLLSKLGPSQSESWKLQVNGKLDEVVSVSPTVRERVWFEEKRKGVFGKEHVRNVVPEYGFLLNCSNSYYSFLTKQDASNILKEIKETAETRKVQAKRDVISEVVHYQIAASFEFNKDGAILVRCPYCGAPRPQTDRTTSVKCPSCSQTYTIPKRIFELM